MSAVGSVSVTTAHQPCVSFAMSCHGYGRYLRTAIDSLLGQERCDLEVIVIDDASKDETADVLRSYRDDPRVRAIRHESRRGHLPSNNEGLALARGKFVGVFDADDFLREPHAIKRQLTILEQNPSVGFVYSSYVLVNEDGIPFRTFQPWDEDYVRPGLEEFKHLIRSLYIPHSGTLVRRSCHQPGDIYDLSLPYSGDWDIWLRLAARFDVGYLAEPLLAYRVHRTQMSQKLISPRAATDNLVRTLDKAFAALPTEVAESMSSERREAYARALLHQTWTDRSLGRIRRSWLGLLEAISRSPRTLATARFYWSAARLALLTIMGYDRYTRLVSARDRIAGGKAPVA